MSPRRKAHAKNGGLRSKPEEKCAWNRLSFVGSDHSPNHSSWDVPMAGGYFGGIEAGQIIARLYIKYLRDESESPTRFGSTRFRSMLASIENKAPSTKIEAESLLGQRVGFFSEISIWLEAAATKLGSSLDTIPERTFIKQADACFLRSDDALMKAIDARTAR